MLRSERRPVVGGWPAGAPGWFRKRFFLVALQLIHHGGRFLAGFDVGLYLHFLSPPFSCLGFTVRISTY